MTVQGLSAELGVKIPDVLRALHANGVRANSHTELESDQVVLALRVVPFLAEIHRLVNSIPLAGTYVERVLGLARTLRSDLIVIDSSLPDADALTSGSIAPVLLTPASSDPTEEVEVRRVLLALDGSERLAGVVPLVADLATSYGAGVRILHACGSPARLPERSLGVVRDGLLDRGVHAYVQEGAGVSAKMITGLAARERAHLVAMDRQIARGNLRSPLSPMAEEVVRRKSGPVLLLSSIGSPRGAE